MKKTILFLLLQSSLVFPMVDNLTVTSDLVKHANEFSQDVFECRTNFKTCVIELSKTINILNGEIDKLLKKYNDLKDIKYVALCCILRDIRVLCFNILVIIRNYKKYGFTRFTWKLNKACDKKLARKICTSFKNLENKLTNDEKIILKDILKELDSICLPGKFKLLGMLKYMRKI